jgi:signal peptidase I
VESVIAHPPLPKLAWVAAVVALLIAASQVFGAIANQTLIVLPIALIPLAAGIGIFRRNVWSARGFALYLLCQLAVAGLLVGRTTLTVADKQALIATLVITLLLAALFFFAARSLTRAQGKHGHPLPWIALSVLTVLPFLFFQAFAIPSASMENTLLLGDAVLVQRWPNPAIASGDVVVFPYPLNPREDYVKRVVGMPGDRLHFANKVLYRNGAPVTEPYAIHREAYVDPYRDNFPSGSPNFTLQRPAQEMLDSHVTNGEIVVPAGKYFVLGDNRDDSLDSRYFGFVDAATVLGKPIFIYNSVDRPGTMDLTPKVSQARGRVRWNRLFTIVR